MHSQPARVGLCSGMYQVDANRYPLRMRWWLVVAWNLVLAKCALVWWAMLHWNVPIHPAWIVVPTLVFAVIATLVWLVARDD